MALETDKARQKAAEQINLANNTIDKGIEHFEKTSLGKQIPTEVKRIKFYDIMKICIVFNQILSMATFIHIYLLSEEKRGFIRTGGIFFYYIYLIASTGTFLLDTVGFLTVTDSLLLPIKLSHLLKLCCYGGFLILGFFAMKNLFAKIFLVIYVLLITCADLIFLYYFILYYRRVNSTEYNEYGNAYTEEEREKMATENSV